MHADRRGAIAIIAAILIVVLVGLAALAIDGAQLYLTKSASQRIADQSALAGVYAYVQNGDSASNYTHTAGAVTSLASANGAGTGTSVGTQIVNSPSGDGNEAVEVTISIPVTLSPLAGLLLGRSPTATVSSTAWAEINSNGIPCIMTTANSMFTAGAASMTATGCDIWSDGSMLLALGGGGGTFTAQELNAPGSIINEGAATITGTQNQGYTAPTDYYSTTTNTAMATAFARATGIASYLNSASFLMTGSAPSGGTATPCTSTAGPLGAGSYALSISTTCTAITFSNSAGQITNITGLSLSGGTTSITLGGSGTYNIASIGFSSGIGTLTIYAPNVPTIKVWSGIVSSGNGLTFLGPATYYVAGGISNTNTGTLTFCNSQSLTVNCQVNGGNTSTFYVNGGIVSTVGAIAFPKGNFYIASGDSTYGTGAGIGNKSGSNAISFGDGTFEIANGIFASGASTISFGATAAGCPTFQILSTGLSGSNSGNAITTQGGSSLVWTCGGGNIDINGTVAVAGTVEFNATNATSGTGTVTINGGLYIGATAPPNCGTGGNPFDAYYTTIIADGALCIGGDYIVDITPPTAITTATFGQIGTVGFATNSSDDSYITDAANIIVAGAFYLPNSITWLTGGGQISGGGGCMEFDVNTISEQAGTIISTNCTDVFVTKTVTAKLVQ